VAVVLAVVAAGSWWVLGRSAPSTGGAGSPGPPAGSAVRAQLLSLDVVGGSAPALAVLGTDAAGERAAAIPIPHDLTLVIPGQGETPASDVAALPGPSVQVALSNEIGAWTQSYVVMTVAQLGNVVERMGGLPVDLPSAVRTGAGVLGPGTTTLQAAQVVALMKAPGGDPDDRWSAVLMGLMAHPPTLRPADVHSTGSLPRAQRTLSATAGGEVLPMPVQTVAGTTFIPQQPVFDHLVQTTWRTPPVAPAIVQNGEGSADVAESIARRIIPAGFRIVLSQNAQSFNMPTTIVIANGRQHEDEARRAQRAIGVGRVEVSPVPSGVGDITVVVGKDFTG